MQRNGAGAAYLNIFHPDIEDFLGTKKINADDGVRIKNLSIGVVIPDKFMELMIADKDVYQFYPKEVYDEYGVTYDVVSTDMGKWYDTLMANPKLTKKKINPRNLFTTIATVLGESGYPYIMFSDNVNKVNTNSLPIHFSNLCCKSTSYK